MKIWSRDEYLKFADSMMNKEVSYYAFEILYWCGIRLGEILALTPSDFNFETQVKKYCTVNYFKNNGQCDNIINAMKIRQAADLSFWIRNQEVIK